MRITWIGHACFLIDAKEVRIVTDPFAEEVPYAFPETPVDLVTVSHDHFDHNAVHRVPGDHATIQTPGSFDVLGLRVRGIPSFHDACGGKERGPNTVYAMTLEGIGIAHLGDLGTPLDEGQRDALSDVEILLIPVGGTFTIDAAQAAEVVRCLPAVRIVIPMHFRTDRIADWPIAPVEEFASLMDNVRQIGASTVEVTRTSMPERREVWILDHA